MFNRQVFYHIMNLFYHKNEYLRVQTRNIFIYIFNNALHPTFTKQKVVRLSFFCNDNLY